MKIRVIVEKTDDIGIRTSIAEDYHINDYELKQITSPVADEQVHRIVSKLLNHTLENELAASTILNLMINAAHRNPPTNTPSLVERELLHLIETHKYLQHFNKTFKAPQPLVIAGLLKAVKAVKENPQDDTAVRLVIQACEKIELGGI